jgi:hypothetical protein
VIRTVSGSRWGGPTRVIEEMRLGNAEGSAEYGFARVASLVVGKDGTIYVSDSRAGTLRAYDSIGKYIRTIGRKGRGPGEFMRADGLGQLPDGRLVIKDPGNQRLVVFSAKGDPLATWPSPAPPGGHIDETTGIHTDTAGFIYEFASVRNPQAKAGQLPFADGYIRFDSKGNVVDTLIPPEWPGETGRSLYHPAPRMTIHRYGYMVTGFSSNYSFDLRRRGGRVLRIERAEKTRVAISAGEKEDWANPQRIRGWEAYPDFKPAYTSFKGSDEGRVWVRVPVPSVERKEPQDTTLPPRQRPLRWYEPYEAWDAFDADGTYLGRVALPPDAKAFFMRGEHIWGTMTDSSGAIYVVRWRVSAAVK